MVAPATVATLRTTEIVVAFVAQILLTHKSPELFDTLGSVCVFAAAVALIFEKQIYDGLSKMFFMCPPSSTSPHELLNEETTETIDTQTVNNVEWKKSLYLND